MCDSQRAHHGTPEVQLALLLVTFLRLLLRRLHVRAAVGSSVDVGVVDDSSSSSSLRATIRSTAVISSRSAGGVGDLLPPRAELFRAGRPEALHPLVRAQRRCVGCVPPAISRNGRAPA